MKKIGVFLPTRSELKKPSIENPGIFLEDIGNSIITELKKEFEVIENLDFRNASVINGKVFFKDFDSSALECYLWFCSIDKNSDGHDIMILEQLEKAMPVINPPKWLKIGLDKFKTSSYLKSHDIPVPDFALVKSNDEKTIQKLFENWKGSVLVKPRFGGFGVGIFKADNASQLIDLLDFSSINTAYLEKFYENDFNDWCGINIIGEKILYAYGKKPSKIKDYKVFDRDEKGGEMILKQPNEEQVKIALEVANKTGMDFFGVDIIKTKDGKYLAIDMNTFPGMYTDMIEPEIVAKEFVRTVTNRVKCGSSLRLI